MIATDIKIAKIVQFGNIQYEDDSIYLDFIQDYL